MSDWQLMKPSRRPRKGTKVRPHSYRRRLILKKEIDRSLQRLSEEKFLDTYTPYYVLDRTGPGALTVLSAVPQGTTVNTHVGDACRAKYLEFRATFFYTPSTVATDTTHNLRITIFRWKLDNAAYPPGIATIFQRPSSGIGDYSNLVTPYNWQGKKQNDFTIVSDRIYSIGSSDKAVTINRRYKLKGRKIQYTAGALTGEGHYYIWISADDVTGAVAPYISGQWYSRFIFTDN